MLLTGLRAFMYARKERSDFNINAVIEGMESGEYCLPSFLNLSKVFDCLLTFF